MKRYLSVVMAVVLAGMLGLGVRDYLRSQSGGEVVVTYTLSNTTADALVDAVCALADSVWTYSQGHPEGFTLDVSRWVEPGEGICVAYRETQDSHSREALEEVVRHALAHEGYVGGWLDTTDSLYYFDSDRLFPEDSLEAAIRFGRENGQLTVYVLSTGAEIRIEE